MLNYEVFFLKPNTLNDNLYQLFSVLFILLENMIVSKVLLSKVWCNHVIA